MSSELRSVDHEERRNVLADSTTNYHISNMVCKWSGPFFHWRSWSWLIHDWSDDCSVLFTKAAQIIWLFFFFSCRLYILTAVLMSEVSRWRRKITHTSCCWLHKPKSCHPARSPNLRRVIVCFYSNKNSNLIKKTYFPPIFCLHYFFYFPKILLRAYTYGQSMTMWAVDKHTWSFPSCGWWMAPHVIVLNRIKLGGHCDP